MARLIIAPGHPPLRPPEFMQTVVVDTEMMPNLMDDGDSNLADQFLLRIAVCADCFFINGDFVG